MKYLIFSDLHGDAIKADWLIKTFQNLKCDEMICLGDVLYHGPRNDLPEGYQPKKVIELLNPYASKIICIQGNCDAEVDQMVLKFQLHQSLDLLLNGHRCHLEHGHHLEECQTDAELVFSGHTHICSIEKKGHQVFLNPGSITIPKNNTPCSYMIFDEQGITLFNQQHQVISQYLFSENKSFR